MELLYAPWKNALLQNTSESTMRFLATWKNGDFAQPSTRWKMNVPKNRRKSIFINQKQTGTCADPWSPHQPSWKVHWHFQVSSYFCTKRHEPKFPFAPLVPYSAEVPRYPKHAAHLPPPPSYIILHTHERNLQLQSHTHSATGDKKISLQNTAAAQNLVSAWCWCLVYRVMPRPLHLPQDIRTDNPGRTNFPHCFFFHAWFCSPSKQSPGWHILLNPGSNNCAPTPLPAHSSTNCWGQTICGHTSTGKNFCPDTPHQTTQEPIHPTVEPPETALYLQQIHQSTSVEPSPLL